MQPRFIMIGGFLGAGKTTTIARLAKGFVAGGQRVGIVTNDQTTDLVDTQSLRAQGFEVGEVAGSCFCCNFNALTSTVEKVNAAAVPDVIIAEPVGSCTDLVATVVRPLVKVYNRPLTMAPYGVILKPSHGLKILRKETTGGFSPKAKYIFRKQLEEADFLILNRMDELSPADAEELTHLLETNFPDRPVVRVSAKTGAGFPELVELLESDGPLSNRSMELDYDIYAEGEAELGWLNGQAEVTADCPFELDQLLLDLIARLAERFQCVNAETAHLKAIGLTDGTYAVANLVSSFTSPELSLPSKAAVKSANIVVNARVATDPQLLERFVREELDRACQALSATVRVETLQSFRPGRPVPTHRILT